MQASRSSSFTKDLLRLPPLDDTPSQFNPVHIHPLNNPNLTNCITLQFVPLPVPVKDYYLPQCNAVQFGREVPTPHRNMQHALQPFILKMDKAGSYET
jgi:hypothetical protein